MSADPLLPDPDHLHLESLSVDGDGVVMLVSAKAGHARCPICQQPSDRVHSRYVRKVTDLPWRGVDVRLRLHLRRFFCDTTDCPRRIFVERVDEVVEPYARRTVRRADMLRAVGFTAGGEGGARLLAQLALHASPDTLLRLLRSTPVPPRPGPRVLGVDDWAKRRGQTYGTILVDLERHEVVDLLPDRTAASLASWLAQHPEVDIISRDRASAYAEGAREGAPDAVQVSDRWHLLKNLGDALERALERQYRNLREVEHQLAKPDMLTSDEETAGQRETEDVPVAPAPVSPGGEQDSSSVTSRSDDRETSVPESMVDAVSQQEMSRELRCQRVEEALLLHHTGMTVTAISRKLGVTRKTVRRWLRTGAYQDRMSPLRRPGLLDPHKEYLRQRWDAGCQNVAQLFRELRDRGYTGSNSHLRHELVRWRHRPASTTKSDQHGVPTTPRRPLTPRRARWLLWRHPDQLDKDEQHLVTAIEGHCPSLEQAHCLTTAFQTIVRERTVDALESWLQDAEASDLPELRSFAHGLRRDRAAVEAA